MPHERFVSILIDEMKIQEDLIWDKYTGEPIGCVDLGDGDVNAATLDKRNELATRVLVFMVKSVVNLLSISLLIFCNNCCLFVSVNAYFLDSHSLSRKNKPESYFCNC